MRKHKAVRIPFYRGKRKKAVNGFMVLVLLLTEKALNRVMQFSSTTKTVTTAKLSRKHLVNLLVCMTKTNLKYLKVTLSGTHQLMMSSTDWFVGTTIQQALLSNCLTVALIIFGKR